MLERLREKTEKLREKFIGPMEIDFENDISFVAQITEEEPRLTLRKDGQEVFNFKNFAPLETKLIFNMAKPWAAYMATENEPPKIVVGRFTDVDGVLSFLHEAGHLDDEPAIISMNAAKQRHRQETNEDKKYKYPASRLLAIKHEREKVILAERNAWAFALKKARWLERTYGISILKKIGNNEEVFKFVNSFLNDHEQVYLSELYHVDIFTKEQMEEFFTDLEKLD